MKKNFKKFWKSPAVTIGLFLVAAALLITGGIGSARAAIQYESRHYKTRVQMYDIGVTLNENGEKVSWRDYGSQADGTWKENTGVLLANMLEEGEEFQLGKTYNEAISVTNSGTIDEYVRVIIHKYWIDADGNKLRTLSPDLIDLNWVNLDTDWILDEEASTDERTILYYNRILPAGETTPDLSDKLTITDGLSSKVPETTEDSVDEDGRTWKVVTITYDYDGVSFQIEAEVDAVQTHNAEDAITSAWGRNVNVSNGSVSLN